MTLMPPGPTGTDCGSDDPVKRAAVPGVTSAGERATSERHSAATGGATGTAATGRTKPEVQQEVNANLLFRKRKKNPQIF